MNDNFVTKQYVDHFLQARIIQQLASAEGPVRFRDLKEEGIDNSLFMYHANKLIDRGLIEKQKSGFQLSVKGARWLNYAGSNLLGNDALPRTLVQCIISAGNSVLIAKRTGSMSSHLNEYMLPGGLYHIGKSAEENIDNILASLFAEETPKPSLLSTAETIIKYHDGFVHHTISYIFEVSLSKQYTPKNNQKFEYTWLERSTITASNPEFAYSHIVPLILAKQFKLEAHAVFRLEQ